MAKKTKEPKDVYKEGNTIKNEGVPFIQYEKHSMKKYVRYAILISCLLFIFIGCRKKPVPSPLLSELGIKEEIKMITFNVRHTKWKHITKGSRLPEIVEILHENKLDIICLQEIWKDQIEFISESMPSYSCYNAGRNDGKEKGENCAIFFRSDRYELLDSDTFWFSKTPEKPGSKSWGAVWTRICSWIKLKDNFTDKEFYVYNLHLSVFSSNSRKNSIKLLMEKIEEPCIITGDFNMDVSADEMLPMKDFNKTSFDEERIDHFLCSQEIEIKEFHIDDRKDYPSDHNALIAILDFI